MHHKATLNGYLAEFTGQTLDKITEDTDRDFFMGAEEAKAYGLIDGAVPVRCRKRKMRQYNASLHDYLRGSALVVGGGKSYAEASVEAIFQREVVI